MAGYSAIEVQRAVHAILSVDSTLLAMLGTADLNSIYDNPSQDESVVFPYIVYESNSAQPFDTKTTNGSEVVMNIAVYSRSGDKEEATDILARIYTLLHSASLTVSGNDFILCRWDGLSVVEVDDTEENLMFRGIIRFRILTS